MLRAEYRSQRWAAALATLLSCAPAAIPAQAATERLSVGGDGGDAGGQSLNAALSETGRFVTFASLAPDLVAGDTNGARDVFIRDRDGRTTQRVSINTIGAEARGPSALPVISADGRYIAFESQAPNLVQGDGNRATDVFVHDRIARITQRVSVNGASAQGNGPSGGPTISADGRYVAFASAATNLAPGDTNGVADVFVRDLLAGVTLRLSVADGGVQANRASLKPSLSADARLVAFVSDASNLVAGDGNALPDVFVRDSVSGTTRRISNADGGEDADGASVAPSISADGDVVAFASGATNLVSDDENDRIDVFVHDRTTAATTRASFGPDGEADGASQNPSISADGRYVAFQSRARNLVVGDANKREDVFVRDRSARLTERSSVGGTATEADGPSANAALAADASTVAFDSLATNLVSDDGNGRGDVFVRTRPAPAVGRKVNVLPASGEVLVSVPVSSAGARAAASVPGLKGRKFVPLRAVRSLPVGSLLDTRKGSVSLTSAVDSRGVTQSGSFSGAVFQVLQSRKRSSKGLTSLRLKGASFKPCRATGAKGAARSAARSRRQIRRLRGSARGRFRTRGRHSAATVRGTIWTVTDRCDGTLTQVKRGRVAVRDFRRKKTIVVKAGKRYLAGR